MPSFTKLAFFSLALAITPRSYALTNDWTVPCVGGSCSWDLPASEAGTLGTLHVWGPPDALSDITPAAGWEITGCDSKSTAMDIQLVCKDNNAHCAHLFQGGAEHTIVRLPQNCGSMPFARVAKHWIPQGAAGKSPSVVSRDDGAAAVHALSLDTNFAAAKPSPNGNVAFAVQGLNVNGDQGNFNLTNPSVSRRHWSSRSAVPGHAVHRRNFVTDALNTLKHASDFNKTITQQLKPIDFKGSQNLFNASASCPANKAIPESFSASVSLDVDANVHAVIQFGVVVSGSIVPPVISEIGIFTGLDGNIDATMKVAATATGQFKTGNIQLFEAGLPGLDFPGIISLGPVFRVLASVDADLEVNADATVDLSYTIAGAKVIFPPKEGSSEGTFTPGASTLSASASPSVKGKFDATGHVIPRVEIGVNAFAGKANVAIFLDLDASAHIDVEAGASASLAASVENALGIKKEASGSAQACVTVDSTLSVDAGAQGDFLGLFDKNTKTSVFNKNFKLLNKCFSTPPANASAPAKTRRTAANPRFARAPVPLAELPMQHSKRVTVACPAVPLPQPFVDSIQIPAPK
ncbi:hypothetical protein BC834DRAFT_966790 [Gloeopeniophorella convolvens]|nr:hypothetical protein BC834DRAFT_966790 [Gloeopeniophorella convolvens]